MTRSSAADRALEACAGVDATEFRPLSVGATEPRVIGEATSAATLVTLRTLRVGLLRRGSNGPWKERADAVADADAERPAASSAARCLTVIGAPPDDVLGCLDEDIIEEERASSRCTAVVATMAASC